MTTYQEVGQAQAYILLNRLGTAQAFIAGPFYPDPYTIPPEAIIDISSTYTVTGFDTTQFPLSTNKEAYIKVRFVGTIFAAKFETTGSNYDTVMEIRDYDTWVKLAEDDDSGEGYTSLIDNLFVTHEVTYIVGIYSYWKGAGGSLNLQITPYIADAYIRFGIAQAYISPAFDIQKFGQAQSAIIIRTNQTHGQSSAHILSKNNRTFGLARFYIGIAQAAGQAQAYIYSIWSFGQAQGITDVPVLPYGFGAAQAVVGFPVKGVTFYDTFTRPAHQLYTPDIGSYSLIRGGRVNVVTIDNGRVKIEFDPYSIQGYGDFVFGRVDADYEIYFEFEFVTPGTQNVLGIYFEIPTSSISIWGEVTYNNGSAGIWAQKGNESSSTTLGYPLENSGIHAVKIVRAGTSISMWVWPKVNEQPTTPTASITLTILEDIVAVGELFIQPYSRYSYLGIKSVYLDNISIISTTYQNNPLGFAQALAKIGDSWHGVGQAFAFISPGVSINFGQAQAYILSDSSAYQNYILATDTPKIFYRMANIPSPGYNTPITDVMGYLNSTIYNYYSPYMSLVPGISSYGTKSGNPNNYYYANITDDNLFSSTNISVEFWVYITSNANEFGYMYSGSSSLRFGICGTSSGAGAWQQSYYPPNGKKPTFSVNSVVGSSTIYEDFQAPEITTNEWHHLVFTTTSKDAKIYVDGILQAEKTWAGALDFGTTGQATYIYAKYSTSYGVNNTYSVDEFALYDYILPSNHIYRHYAFVKGLSSIEFGQAIAYCLAVPAPGYTQDIKIALSQANILHFEYQKHGQAQAMIVHGWGFGQAVFKLAYPSDDQYRAMVVADGATSYYGVHTSNIGPQTTGAVDDETTYWRDELRFHEIYNGSAWYSKTAEISPVSNERFGAQDYLYSSYARYYHNRIGFSTEPNNFQVSPWTFEAWVRAPSASSVEHTIIGLRVTTYGYIDLAFGSPTTRGSAGSYIVLWSSYNLQAYSTGVQYTPNQWYHIAYTNSNGTFYVYIDGVLRLSVTIGWTNNALLSSYVYLGYSATHTFGTPIDNTNRLAWDAIAYYPFELSAANILKHFLASKTQGFGQALAQIRSFAFAQTQASIKSHKFNALGQAAVYTYPRWKAAQAQAFIDFERQYGQALAHIIGFYKPKGQAQAYISPAFNQNIYGQAIARIRAKGRYGEEVETDIPSYWFRMQETSGTSAEQMITTINGTYTSVTLNQSSPFTDLGNTGTKSIYVSGGANLTTNQTQPSTPYSIEFWAKPDTDATTIMAYENAGGNMGNPGVNGYHRYIVGPVSWGQFGITMGTNGIELIQHDNNWMPVVARYENVNLGSNWYHVVVTFSNKTPKIYINGNLVYTGFRTERNELVGSVLGSGPYGLHFKGYIAEYAVYNKVLSDNRILAHFQAGIMPQGYGQARAFIIGSTNQMVHGAAIARILVTKDGYRKVVMEDKPIIYLPMDEPSLGTGTNLVRTPNGGTSTYTASSQYSAAYSPDKAADGNYSDGWASSGYTIGQWWQVSWSVPQTIRTVRVTARPSDSSRSGQGRILFSDGTSYSVKFPYRGYGVNVYSVSPTSTVTWMRLISDGDGLGDPGFTEIEAYATEDYGYIHNIIGRQHAVAMNGLTYGGFSEPGEGSSITLSSKRITWESSSPVVSVTKSLTFPGVSLGENIISEFMWLEKGDKVVVNVTQSFSNGGNIGMGSTDGNSENLWYSTTYENPTAGNTYSFTALNSGVHAIYSWPLNGSKTGAGTYTIYKRQSGESFLPDGPGNPVTVEFWMYWTGEDNKMPFAWGTGYTQDIVASYYNLYLNGGYIGFNNGNGDYRVSSAGLSGKWVHIAAVFYSGQLMTTANKLYINGVAQTLASSGSIYYRSIPQSFSIGGMSNTYTWAGGIEEVAIYNYELASNRILLHSQSRSPQGYAQAHVYISPAFNQNIFGQAMAWISYLGYGQAQAYIWSYNVSLLAQATALISRLGEGLVRRVFDINWAGWPTRDYFTIGDTIAWGIEETINQIYYDDGTGPPSYPGTDAGAAWSARFIADETGNWWFRTVSDDNSEVFIDSTVVVHNYSSNFFSGGHGDWDSDPSYDDPIYLYSGTEYNLHIRWAQGTGPYTIHVYYKRPSDSSWYLLTNNNPPWMSNIIGSRYRSYGTALADIQLSAKRWQSGQAQAHILGRYRAFGMAIAQRGWLQYGIAQAHIYAINVNQYGTAIATISWLQYGTAIARIYAFDVRQYGTALATISWTKYGTAQAWIRATYYGVGTAIFATLKSGGKAQSVANIKQTYPLMAFDEIHTETANLSIALNTFTISGMPSNVIDKDDYNTWWMAVNSNQGQDVTGLWIKFDLGSQKSVNMYRILPWSNIVVSIQYSVDNSNWYDAVTDIELQGQLIGQYVSGYNPDWTASNSFVPITARYWRVICTFVPDIDLFGFTTIQLGSASVVNPTFAQATAILGHFLPATAQAYISPAFNQNVYGQTQTDVRQTYQTFGQSQTWMIPPTQWAQANANMVQTYFVVGTALARIIPPTRFGQAAAQINAFNVEGIGQAAATIFATVKKYGQAKAIILKSQGYSSAKTLIYRWASGTRFGKGYGMAKGILDVHPYWPTGEAQAHIRVTNRERIGQAMATIIRHEGFALSKALILHHGYQQYGQAVFLFMIHFGLANAGATILRTYEKHGQGKARIRQTYISCGQALSSIRGKMHGQAAAMIIMTYRKYAQARTQIDRGHRLGQAQARMLAFDVPKVGMANCYIIVSSTNPPIIVGPPTSNYYTYLVRFNDNDLPGYAQQEDYDSVMRITNYYVAYLDSSFSEYMGLENKNIQIGMRIWEETYFDVKTRAQRAATFLRRSRGFQRLYLGHRDKYYLALAKRILVEKSVASSSRILDYIIEFEAKPWLISNNVYTTSGTGTVVVNRNLSEGGWTPAIITIEGTGDISITGVGIGGQSTGTITLTGDHASTVIVDTEAFTATDINGTIQNEYINKDFSLYLGPGTTTFTITGASNCTIQWQSRWYL